MLIAAAFAVALARQFAMLSYRTPEEFAHWKKFGLEHGIGVMLATSSERTDRERLYLDRLMKTHDANEGLAAFLARRNPAWEHR